MNEDFLHFIWRQRKYQSVNLKTVKGKSILVKTTGAHNQLAGPDFFNAQIMIGSQLWAGNVEIHLKSSDWYVHSHETDSNYDNVILHVVWEHDADVFRKDNSIVPTLELKNFINQSFLVNYQTLFAKSKAWINCEKDISDVDSVILNLWLERLYIERLEEKSDVIQDLLHKSKNDWEAVLFGMLSKSFGLNINGEAFLSMSQSIDYSLVRKLQSKQKNLEALFMGQIGLLNEENPDQYFNDLKLSYQYLSHKHKLENQSVLPAQFYRLRPPNFPTMRLAQMAGLYQMHQSLFSTVLECNNLSDFYKVFDVTVSSYWQEHYNFGTVSTKSKKKLSKAFIHLILINTVVPIKFAYAKSKGIENTEAILDLIQLMPAENNSVIKKFQDLREEPITAKESQAYIQLKSKYCEKNKCLQCAVGNALLSE